jgi:hypothetical protein
MSTPIIAAVMKQCVERGYDYDSIVANHRISWGNSKLKADGIASFNIPPVSTCPARGACEKFCYATQGQQWMSSGYKRRVAGFKATLENDFVTLMIAELTSERVKILRIHDSGDFYSPQYMLKWFEIARALPNVKFYAYTKQVYLMKKLWSEKPNNIKLIQSLDGKFDAVIDHSLPHAKIFATIDDLHSSGYVDASESDLPASMPEIVNIGLVIHGNKKKQFKASV